MFDIVTAMILLLKQEEKEISVGIAKLRLVLVKMMQIGFQIVLEN